MVSTWQQVQGEVRRRQALAAVAASPESVRHLAGVHFASQVMIRRRFAFVVIPATGNPVLLVQAVLEETARSKGGIPEVVTYVTGPVEALAGLLKRRDIHQGTLLVELDFLPAADAQQLTSLLPEAGVEDAGDLFQSSRQVRLPAESRQHRRYSRAAERAIQIAFSLAAGGNVTERSVYGRMQDALLTLGEGLIPFLSLASGPERTLEVHAHPTDRMIGPGDLLRVDMVGFFSGVYTDMARTVVIGEATPEQRQLYRKVRTVQKEVIASLRPGMIAEKVYERFRELVKSHGLSFAYRYVGHSTGYGVVEDPVLTPGVTAPLLPGMVLCVEVMDRVPGLGAIHLEDMLLLTERGPEVWTDIMAADELPEMT
ncbi:MAG TPA: Xaa-Pro peptidase family protein [bacterium]|nr:Xaa-Pro peptidase family protein [bacterium]